MKLQTLNDLTTDWLKSTKGKNKGWGFVNAKILRQEAIKWIKEDLKFIDGMHNDITALQIIEFWMERLNITKEDLK